MIWVWVVILVIVIGAVAVLAAGREAPMAEAYEDRPDKTIPTGRPLTADDLQTVKFTTAVRGYRMDEVDALLDRVRADLIAREAGPDAPAEHESPAEHENEVAEEQALPTTVTDTTVTAEPPERPPATEDDGATQVIGRHQSIDPV